MKKDFWKNKKVLITGHTGFKGSWLSLWLQKNGAEVIGYSLPAPTNPSLFSLSGLENLICSITGDIRDLNKLKNTIQTHKPDIVLHLAAQSLVRLSYENPVETFETNVLGTINVLEAVRTSESVKVVVNITSDKCYENMEWLWGYKETDPMGGYDPYSCSKGCAELVISAYKRSFFSENKTGIASARAGNVIGGGDWAEDRLIPDVFKSILSNQKLLIRNPESVRPWQHVLEPLRGYLMLAEKLWENPQTFSQGWNFGPNDQDTLRVIEIVNKINLIWDEKFEYELNKEKSCHEANYLKLDCSLSKAKLAWKPLFTIDDSIKNTIEWFKAYKNNENMHEFTINQINSYEKKIEESDEKKLLQVL
ncbi:MAG: CDP-glucose 4,6-dehydratase [Candidatus Gastranaerophilaceae bacterium]